jgi:hypothetical protein
MDFIGLGFVQSCGTYPSLWPVVIGQMGLFETRAPQDLMADHLPHKTTIWGICFFWTKRSGKLITANNMFMCLFLDNFERTSDIPTKILSFCWYVDFKICSLRTVDGWLQTGYPPKKMWKQLKSWICWLQWLGNPVDFRNHPSSQELDAAGRDSAESRRVAVQGTYLVPQLHRSMVHPDFDLFPAWKLNEVN